MASPQRSGEKKKKLIEFTKRLLWNAGTQALNLTVPVEFALEVAQDFYDIFISADEEDRVALIESAQAMSEVEREALERMAIAAGSSTAGPSTTRSSVAWPDSSTDRRSTAGSSASRALE